jgi:hypothetical protein
VQEGEEEAVFNSFIQKKKQSKSNPCRFSFFSELTHTSEYGRQDWANPKWLQFRTPATQNGSEEYMQHNPTPAC